MKTRTITALLIILCVIPPLVFGGVLLYLLIAGIIAGGAIELLGLSNQYKQWPKWICFLAGFSVFISLFFQEAFILPYIAMMLLIYFSLPVFMKSFSSEDSFLCMAYFVFFMLIAKSFLKIYQTDTGYIWYIIIVTYLCDTGAYFSGMLFGKHKLNERISPKKTIEGAIGGWLVAIILSTLSGMMFLNASLPFFLITSGVLAISGQVGDLAFSAVKRQYKLKDFSNLLPGHGGVLDRVDSLVFNFIVFYFLMVVMSS